MKPLLSIIIVAYKSRHEIGPCLASLPRQLEDQPVQVVVVDNFPADGTSAWVRLTYPEVEVVEPAQNVGFGRANNLGYARVQGDVVLFLNPDTIANAAAIRHVVHRVRNEPELGLITPRLLQADGSLDLACRRSIPTAWDGFCRAVGLAAAFPHVKWFSGYNLTHLPLAGTYPVGAINGAFMLGRREVFDRVADPSVPHVFDERFFMYGDDLDLCIRVARAGYRIVYDGRHAITHLKGLSVGRDYDRMASAIFDANRDVYLKHFGRSALARMKWRLMFGAWKRVALLRARWRGHRRVRPV